MRILHILGVLGFVQSAKGGFNCYNRCDKLALDEFVVKQAEFCKGSLKNSPGCIEIENDIVEYLTAFYVRNDALCVRIHEKYSFKFTPTYMRNPDRII